MTKERWEQIDRIFSGALELPEVERQRFVAEQCHGRDELRREVETLLLAKTQAGPFLDTPAIEVAARGMAEAAPRVAAGQTVGPYQLLLRLGAGGMGEVWQAHDSRIGRDVAIKFCGEEFTIRFEREAQAIGALNHPNICHLYDVGPNYLVMELIEGDPPKGPMPLEKVLGYARQIVDALDTAHQNGIVHCDLKPDNIRIRPDGVVKILDFGVAKVSLEPPIPEHEPAASGIPAIQSGLLAGTPGYMSPEQIAGKRVDKRADVWGFGLLMFEMLTGEHFSGQTDWNSVPVEVRRLLRRCLEKDPKQRLRDIGDVWALLEDGKVNPPQPKRAGFPRWGWLAIASVIAIAAGAVLIGSLPKRSEPKSLVRLDVDLGPAVSLSLTGGGDPILSADGTRIAYVSSGHVFTRRLDESEARELSAAQGGTSPFFSPDGQWIAYFGRGKLRKISVNGGEAIDICGANAAYTGGAWGEDNNIIAALSATGPLSQVSSGGGEPREITKLDVKNGEASHRLPQILAGHDAVIYTAHTSIAGFDDAKIEVIDLRNHQRKTLVRGGTYGRYLPSGHLVYVSRGTLFAVPFDVKRLEIYGKPVPVLDHVIYSPQFGSASISFSQNGTIVYRRGGVGSRALSVNWLDVQGKAQALFAKSEMYMDPRLSPDGKRLAYAVGEGPDRGVWVYDTQRETATRLTPAEGIFRSPVWTPDGRFIVCRSEGGISWVRADGSSKPMLLTHSEHLQIPASFTADGRRLAFTYVPFGSGGASGTDLWTMLVESDGTTLHGGTPEPFLQTPFDEYHPSFSPDGRWIAYTSNETGTYQVYVRAFPDTGEKWMVSKAGGVHPVFSRDGLELYFLDEASRIAVVRYTVRDKLFRAERPRTWSKSRLLDLGVNFHTYDPDPLGRRFVVLMPPEDAGPHDAQNHLIFLQNFFDDLRRRVRVAD